jgi:hypothetical protein
MIKNNKLKNNILYTILIIALCVTIPISEVNYLDYGCKQLILKTEEIMSERGLKSDVYYLEAPVWYFPYYIQVWAVTPTSNGADYEQYLYNLFTGEISKG